MKLGLRKGENKHKTKDVCGSGIMGYNTKNNTGQEYVYEKAHKHF